MSDMKYMIACVVEDDDSRRRKPPFPCLAMVRYAAAGMVTVLAVTVISMVIRAVLRSEDIRLSVNNGYVAADILWNTDTPEVQTRSSSAFTFDRDHVPILSATSTIYRDRGFGAGVDEGGGRFGGVYPRTRPGCYLGCGSSDFNDDDDNPPPPPSAPVTQVTMKAATATNLRVILIVNNPGGRTKVDCNSTVVTITDTSTSRPPYKEEIIATLQLSNFTVQPQTAITLQKRVTITDPAVLGYIWDRHRGRPAFGVVLRVSSSVASYPLGKMTEPKTRSYVCRSVTLGLAQLDETSFDVNRQGDCHAEELLGAPAGAPAPAPAP
ncbi:hypothetical protein BRADI_4g01860v3 [Brachypodium distachyon]|uniref:Uncharacterized protein n=1 Tax=Brachypodium distachyon TaxID=15368 RepID=A0A0Q3IHZ8_BRADI|nr:hypothetical protein BRADI_4g01860v3 [Brachypodium distachyon]